LTVINVSPKTHRNQAFFYLVEKAFSFCGLIEKILIFLFKNKKITYFVLQWFSFFGMTGKAFVLLQKNYILFYLAPKILFVYF